MLVPEAAKLKKKRWAVVYPNYEYGQSAAATFKAAAEGARSPTSSSSPSRRRRSARSTPAASCRRSPMPSPTRSSTCCSAPTCRSSCARATTRGLFKGREVVSLLTGEPEYLDPLKDEAPDGWIVTGYPWYGIQTPEHKKPSSRRTRRKYNDYPRLGSVVGYTHDQVARRGIKKAKATDTEKLVAAFEGLQVDDAVRQGHLPRRIDHQSTMGAFVGKTKNDGGKGVMVDYRYLDGAKYLPTDDEVKKMRAAD